MGIKTLRRYFIFLCLTLICGANIFADSKAAQLDSYFRHLSKRGQFNGSVLVAERGQLIYKNGFGEADARKHLRFRSNTPCYLASLTKQFTAMAIMMLADQGKLAYSDSLSKYFPEFPAYAQKITIRHLLNHTSGISDSLNLGMARPGVTNADVLKAMINQPTLRFSPGDQFEYSNAGYILLATIVEKVSAETYPAFLQKNIFDRLKMKDTFVFTGSEKRDGIARGYGRFGDDADYTIRTCGDGGMYSSVDDLFKWDQSLYSEKLVKQSTLAEAFRATKLNDGKTSPYGFGWALTNPDTRSVIQHSGRFGGFITYIERFLKQGDTIILLTNHGFRRIGEIVNGTIHILNAESYQLPSLSIAEVMYREYRSSGKIEPAVQKYETLRKKASSTYDFSESELNILGYKLLAMNKVADAIEILKLNVTLFPSSGNVYDSLGEAYMRHGDKEPAIQNYKKSLELTPGNLNARMMLQRLSGK